MISLPNVESMTVRYVLAHECNTRGDTKKLIYTVSMEDPYHPMWLVEENNEQIECAPCLSEAVIAFNTTHL